MSKVEILANSKRFIPILIGYIALIISYVFDVEVSDDVQKSVSDLLIGFINSSEGLFATGTVAWAAITKLMDDLREQKKKPKLTFWEMVKLGKEFFNIANIFKNNKNTKTK